MQGVGPRAKSNVQPQPIKPEFSRASCSYFTKGRGGRTSYPFLHDTSTQRTQEQQDVETGPVVQGISVSTVVGPIVEALQSPQIAPWPRSRRLLKGTPVKQGTQDVIAAAGSEELIPKGIGRPVYVLIVEYGGQTYNLCHDVSRRQEDDKP